MGDDNRKRNMDRRRETSKHAARDRRAKESDIYDDLKEVVPVVDEATITHVDRIALLRVAATVCRYRKNVGDSIKKAPSSVELLLKTAHSAKCSKPWSEDCLTECLDGFIAILDSDSTMLYMTESVSLYLGLTQTDFAGRHLRDFISADDYKDFLNVVQELSNGSDERESRQCVLRMKSVISPRGRNLNLKSALLKPVAFTIRTLPSPAGHCILMQGVTMPAGQGTITNTVNAITKNGDSTTGTFMTRHTCDMRISYVSDMLNALLKSDNRTLIGASYYELIHPADAHLIVKCVKELLAKGHSRSPYYRLVTATGALAWFITEATTISHTTRGQKGQYIICIHHLLGQQSEADCNKGACERAAAAGIAVRVKQEPDDKEYYTNHHQQPEMLECIDFCPLIDDDEAVGEYSTVPVVQTETANRSSSSSTSSSRKDATPTPAAAPPSRKKSYEEVLQWLFRDEPQQAAPDRTYYSTARLQSGEADRSAASRLAATCRRPTEYGGGGAVPSQGSVWMQAKSPMQQQLSPQSALTSTFKQSCQLASPPASATNHSSPDGTFERTVRTENVRGGPASNGYDARIQPTSSLPLPNGAPLQYPRGASATVLSTLPPSNISRATPFAARPAPADVALPCQQSREFLLLGDAGRGATAPGGRGGENGARRAVPAYGCSPMTQPQLPQPLQQHNPVLLNDVLLSAQPMARFPVNEDTFGANAPFIDPCVDMQPIGGPITQDIASLLELPPWTETEDGPLPNLPAADSYYTFPLRDSPPSKKQATDDAVLLTASNPSLDFDDWPRWLDSASSSFLDAPRRA